MRHLRFGQAGQESRADVVTRLGARFDQAAALEQVVDLEDDRRTQAQHPARHPHREQLVAGAQHVLADALLDVQGQAVVDVNEKGGRRRLERIGRAFDRCPDPGNNSLNATG